MKEKPDKGRPCLELRDVRKRLGRQTVLGGISLSLGEGEMMALLGPSGSGKTTLLKLVAGLLRPDGGDILLDGASLLPVRVERRNMALVFQSALLFPFLTVGKNVAFGLSVRKRPREEIRARVAEMLAQVQLEGLEDRYPHQISGGQRQRAALARALVLRPRVLLLDEPFSSLDPMLRQEMRELVVELHRRHGTTTLFVTHDREEALTVADRIALILEGRILQVGPGDEFYDRPFVPQVAEFFGGANTIRGEGCGAALRTAWGLLRLPPGTEREGPVTATIRPEHLRLIPETEAGSGRREDSPRDGAAEGENAVSGVIAEAEFMGTRREYRVAVGPESFKVVTLPTETHAVGERVTLVFPPERIHVYDP